MSVNKVELELRLIDLVRDHPYLYDKSHPTYRDIKQKELTWAMIAQQLDMSGKDCRNLWNSLRNQYTASVRKNKLQPGSSYYRHTKAMQFYLEASNANESGSFSNIEFEVISDGSNNSGIHDIKTEVSECSPIVGIVERAQVDTPTKIPARRSSNSGAKNSGEKKRSMDCLEENIVELLKQQPDPDGIKEKDDEYEMFCSSLVPKLRRIAESDLRKACELQFNIYQLFYQAEMQVL